MKGVKRLIEEDREAAVRRLEKRILQLEQANRDLRQSLARLAPVEGMVEDAELTKLIESERRAHGLAQTLAEASLAVVQEGELGAVLEALLDHLARLVPYDSANVMLLDDDQRLAVRVARGYEGLTDATATGRIAFETGPMPLLQAILKGAPVLVRDSLEEPTWQRIAGTEHVRSWLGVPLIRQGRTIGLFSLDKTEPGFFTQEHVRLAEALAPSAATAIATARLLAERKRAEEALRNLPRQLLAAQENERRRIARELHDEIGQVLTAVKLNLQSMQRLPGAEPLGERLAESVSWIDRGLTDVRNLALDLRPSILDDLGLAAALRWFVERQAGAAALESKLTIEPGLPRLPSELEVACFRVVQEAITNVARHARAHSFSVDLHRHEGALRVSVRDDGVGFDTEAARERARQGRSLGVLGMEERVSLLGGLFALESSQGSGSEVRAQFPLPDPASPEQGS